MNIIRHTIANSMSAGESSEVLLEVDTDTGETELIISKTIIERYPVTDYNKVVQLHKDLNRGGGRKVFKLIDLTK